MTPLLVARAGLLGVVAGLRSQFPAAALAARGLEPASRSLALLSTPGGRRAAYLAAAGEIVVDKLPVTPDRVEVVNPGAKKNEVVYTYAEAELHRLLGQLEKRGRRYKEPIQRYKGLGEMDADQLAETTMDPRHRTLRRVRMADAAAAERVFDLLMGNDVAPRKDFIVDGASRLDRERIDT